MKQVFLRDFVDMNFVVKEKELIATLETLHIKRERAELIGFRGGYWARNHLSRKNLPWRIHSDWKTTKDVVEMIKRQHLIRTRRFGVFAACWLIGDQSSVATLRNLVENLLHCNHEDSYYEWISRRQEQMLCSYNVTLEQIEKHKEIWGDFGTSKIAYATRQWYELSDQLIISYGQIVQYRLEWRKLYSDKNNDCRTYRGQPDRDMVCV